MVSKIEEFKTVIEKQMEGYATAASANAIECYIKGGSSFGTELLKRFQEEMKELEIGSPLVAGMGRAIQILKEYGC